ncbi:tripartite tricarboxylate transporter substrate binding protein [Siccirubricoccus sp. KC 17139]|uniref:Tripartite tricarboxylate transporter substrate binding protein n=1 Tax=Siccirubricoccus soli TaxID=2899147 RepID=A0ABT1D1L7_9PROT|nr:tripartite tricarboxylate transporter substrate binding protein [Siccirubricoccus soli]MCO6415782.1 tripartite tricarboxylate transporter substrate binding protein [Siccirubricoccus soli]MCP2681914.1 tripartite tricarboxylate transporter substrate binding protein [Siccirubricoccus soli]
MRITRRRVLNASLAAPALPGTFAAAAQDAAWPSRPVRFVVPFSPAGTTDIAARLAAEMVGKRLGQQVVVENRPGASGNIAAEMVARAAPDGYTMLVNAISTAAINYTLFGERMPVRPEELAAVALLIRVPNVVFVPATSPIRDLAGLIAAAKARPDALNYGSAGSGGSGHLAFELFKLRAGVRIVHVGYRGAGPMLVEAVAGRLDAACDNMPSCIGHIRDGRLRPLAVTSAERAHALPDVPTFAEAGVKDAEATGWFGIQAPARTPRPVIERMGRELDVVTRDPAYVARIRELGGNPPNLKPDGGTTPEAYETFIAAEIRRWGEVIRATGITAD